MCRSVAWLAVVWSVVGIRGCEVAGNYRGEVRIVSTPEVKVRARDGVEFCVARAVSSKESYDRQLGTNIREDTYIGLIANDEAMSGLMGLDIGSKVVIEGELYWDDYIDKGGRPGRGRQCALISVGPVPVSALGGNGAVPVEDAGYLASLVRDTR
jgi:hypothetical protein